MTNEDWSRAITKYGTDEEKPRPKFEIGGSLELAEALGKRAAIEPQRFAELALTFDEQTPASNIIAVINAVTGKVSPAQLTELCEHAQRVAGEAAGQAICRAIANSADEATDAMVDLLDHYSRATDPAAELSFCRADGELDLATQGLNSTRGVAATAIGQVLFANDAHAPRLLPVVMELSQDPILSVRAEATRPVLALFNSHLEQALDIADSLFDTSAIEIHHSRSANRLLKYALRDAGTRFARHLNRALEADHHIAVRAGRIWAQLWLTNLLPEACPTEVIDLPSPVRLGAAQTVARAPHLALDVLIKLFDDEDAEVRKAAAAAIRVLDEPDSAMIRERLVAAYTCSQAFPDTYGELFHALEGSNKLLPSTTIDACERAVEHAGGDLGDLSKASAATSRDIVTVVLRLYRQGDEPMRERCLDVIDQLADVGAYGLPEAIQHER
ncbi:hypothetical protein [Amycolatopsis thailandensis]|uniref:hypothetical protein n=1 Tax=Amycolatopsis thailandensis TaxID=589330 RepID=UPI003626FE77